ncbi:flagellar type III secretion system pore protein FliP [Mobiluncus mulieris]|uniref:Flagellar biosynthetic protein FliP n=1 Tax=Mobiluncus mulieris TaxID=2052 RepID=A0ABD4TUG5_9ACTO|nr:flagellar type III secretion system pore protein FliP [Mobiluncus mulieris]MCU9968035.1 flagellar type III secretion system pore protein FliP [Mobiluncus mulieris]MCV0009079.1 flagellar type III secretion system pore protein FliP [Mobiluncus mulieris]NMW74760.1 flagellar type III secretion system pore protein FliP [Mobiluncus mulieris]NMX00937.1 flagellar type III secretion system pore protein FliP [Mobiluncus mulieris]
MSDFSCHPRSREASLREFQEWQTRREARRVQTTQRREARRVQTTQRRERRQAITQELCRQQFATTARRLQRLGFRVDMPLDFTRDTLAPAGDYSSITPRFSAENRGYEPAPHAVGQTPTANNPADGSRFGFGLARREWSPVQWRNRLKLAVAWFLAVIALFAGYLTLPGAVATGVPPVASPAVHEVPSRIPAGVDSRPAGMQMAPREAVATTPNASLANVANVTSQTGITAANAATGIAPGAADPNRNPNRNPNRGGPESPTPPANPPDPGIGVQLIGFDKKPTTTVLVFLLITVLSVAPSLLLMMTSFTKIFIVLAMARNALGLNQIPPTQVLSGLAIFLSLFIMAPTVNTLWTDVVQPLMDGKIEVQEVFKLGEKPFRDFMGPLTREEDIALMTRAANRPNPESLDKTPFTTLVPAFMISEVRSAFIIGFVVFIPFLVIDLVVGAALMSMGMMMLPPVMVSLPFKVLLFVMVDGWGMLTQTLIGTYR